MESPLHLQQRPRSAKSVEDMVDPRRISSLSTTSGCSDCTTATLQGARSFGSSYFDDETAATLAALESDDDTSLSSNDEDFSSSHSQVNCNPRSSAVKFGQVRSTAVNCGQLWSSTVIRDHPQTSSVMFSHPWM